MAELTVLDVGQGDSFLIVDETTREAALIDCPSGRAGAPLIRLAERGVEHLVAVVITHMHQDHYGGIVDFLRRTTLVPERLIVSPAIGLNRARPAAISFLRATKDAVPAGVLREIARPETTAVRIGGAELTLLAPTDEDYLEVLAGGDANLAAVATRVRVGDRAALLCSDVPAKRWKRLANAGVSLAADAMTLPHHGGEFGGADYSLEHLLTDVAPEVMFTSVGARNGYGHPAASTLKLARRRVSEKGSQLFCTQLNEICRVGAIRSGTAAEPTSCAGSVDFSGAGLSVSRNGFSAFVDAQQDPHCRCAPKERK